MAAMSSRFKNLGFGSKRKSSANIQTNVVSPTGSTSTAGTPPPNSSQTSLPPMNSQQLGRPPSYSYNTATGRPITPVPPGQQQTMAHHPPPIDTRQGYPAANSTLGQPQPPGYGGGGYGQPLQPAGMQHPMGQFGQGRPAEVEGAGRSKAQLIVGIDFVCQPAPTTRRVLIRI
jgi:hypothetical protein